MREPAARVDVAIASLAFDRCVACDRRLSHRERRAEGSFPIVTPDRLLLICAQVCARCLDDAEVGHRIAQLAGAIFLQLGRWYVGQSAV
jgi:hypothetical protein